MNWNEKAEVQAGRWSTEPDHGDCIKCQINEQVREGFVMGAAWMRDELRKDEAVERLLLALHPTIDSIRDDHPDVVEKAKTRAADLITALIGEEP